MNKFDLTEADIRTKFITPAIAAKWDVMTQVLEERYFTAGRVIVRGKTVKRGEAKKADYILFYKPNIPIAVVEAKDATHEVGDGMQQALDYAEILDVPFAFSSNGSGFLEHDRTKTGGKVERTIPMDQFPSPDELWDRYRASKGYTPALLAKVVDMLDHVPMEDRDTKGDVYEYMLGKIASIELQREFAHRLRAIERCIIAHQRAIDECDTLFDSIHDGVFRGELTLGRSHHGSR